MTAEVTLGRVSGLHGVRGWLKVYSYTDPPNAIADYSPWCLEIQGQRSEYELERLQQHGNRLLARIRGVDNRDLAASLVGATITITRDQLPATSNDEYYWADLVGLEVVNEDGVRLGTVDRLFETGANDVVVVTGERERLIPWLVGQVIRKVDLKGRQLRVDWDADF
ncbi:MAG: ribosome maturation factor RimM [Gammaproteobacteria bacterium]|nr:ribosome maturation factor RimM [Gammaproteobacteria bacterium]NND59119.1 ribosome maturation factor RimM [Gammaproteobacteria bacterium]